VAYVATRNGGKNAAELDVVLSSPEEERAELVALITSMRERHPVNVPGKFVERLERAGLIAKEGSFAQSDVQAPPVLQAVPPASAPIVSEPAKESKGK
jgi:hypothetical protein